MTFGEFTALRPVHILATVSRALDRAGFAIISQTLQYHLQEPENPAIEEDLKELEKLFLSLAYGAAVQYGPGGGLIWARTSHDTVRGRIEVSWQVEDREVGSRRLS